MTTVFGQLKCRIVGRFDGQLMSLLLKVAKKLRMRLSCDQTVDQDENAGRSAHTLLKKQRNQKQRDATKCIAQHFDLRLSTHTVTR